ncbi:hypothetical protein V8C42DRAFT_320575 [Trichoderma barbatum]
MSTSYLVKKLSEAIAQPFAQKLLRSYAAVSHTAKQVPRQKIQFVVDKGMDLSTMGLDVVLNDKFSGNVNFRNQLLKGCELDKTFHFAFSPLGVPLQGDCILKEGQTIEVEAFGWALRDTLNKKIYIFFKGTVFMSTELLASTGTNKVGFNNDDTVPASVLIDGMPGQAKGSNARWMSSSVKYIGTDGKERVFVKSMTDQMREYARRKDLEGYEIIMVGHSVGATELAIMYTHLGIANPMLLSTPLALCVGPYRFLSEEAVQWMNKKAPGLWVNLINGNDPVTLASTIWGSSKTAYISRPSITDKFIQEWLKANPFSLPGQSFGYESSEGVGLSPMANHNSFVYELAVRPENFDLIQLLEDGLEGVLRFKPKCGGPFQPIEPRTEKDREHIAMLKLDSEGYIHN